MGDENELMLELSIGGIFANPNQKPNLNVTESLDKVNRIEDLNPQSNDLRRRKREARLKKSVDFGSCGSVSGPFVENKEWLERQIVGQNDEPARKKEKMVGNMLEKFGSVLTATVDDGNVNLKRNDGGGRCYCKMKSSGCASLANSDDQCSYRQGGASDNSRSNSSNSQLDHQPASTSTASVGPSDQPTGSSKQTISALNPNNQSNPYESTVSNPPSKPDPSSQHQQASLLARMPCVSTTGNGPNGKTVSGFLYRYTKNEVSIVCVCHGRSFSPAGFVEHAGGVDIAHPLKHITIFPAAFAS